MRILVATDFAYELSWVMRLLDEGHDVRYWIQPQAAKSVGNGLVEKFATWEDGLAWLHEKPSDALALFGSSKLGEKADAARALGIATVGGGAFCDRLENDRSFGFKVAKDAGALLPPYEEFASFDQARARAAQLDIPMYFKSDRYLESDATHGADNGAELAEYLDELIAEHGAHGTCILQRKIDGVPFSTARWWNGKDWTGPFEATYENKKFMNEDVGPSTGCAFNAVWFYDDEPEIARRLGWPQLAEAFRGYNAPPGIYDINALVADEGDVYFLEWTPRMGYDAEMTAALLLPNLGAHLKAVAHGAEVPEPSTELAYAVRLSVPPYPWEHGKRSDKGGADGTRIRGADGLWDGRFIPYAVRAGKDENTLEVAGPEGCVGLAADTGDAIDDIHDRVIEYAKDVLQVRGLQFRTDGADDCKAAAEKLIEAGFEVHAGLLES